MNSVDSQIQNSLDALKQDGFVILESVLSSNLVRALRVRYEQLLASKMARVGICPVVGFDEVAATNRDTYFFVPQGGNHDYNRWNMHLPSEAMFFSNEVLANRIARPLIDRFLGSDCVLTTASSDTCYPDSLYQVLHQDSAELHLTINIPLVDVTEDHGPTELWPGTHLECGRFTRSQVAISPGQALAYSQRPSRLATAPAGSLIIRDQRVLHRGTPNLTSEPRPMLSLLFAPAPRHVPPRFATDWLARTALLLRNHARRVPGHVNQNLLNFGNRLGSIAEAFAFSDRDWRRVIPRSIWADLDRYTRRLLRFASVENQPSQAQKEHEALVALQPLAQVVGGRMLEWARASLPTRPRR